MSHVTSAHPAPELLALYSRGDLGLFTRLRVKAHVLECASCEQQIASFGLAFGELKREAATETLTAFEAIADWNRLEREMLGNIGVGVSAARCIDKVGRTRSLLPRLSIVAGLGVLFVAGWLTHIPAEQTRRLAATLSHMVGAQRPVALSNVLQTTPTGIAVRSQGVTLTILHPPTAMLSLSGNSSVEARYVDEDTGQVTITNVYGQ